MVPPKKDPILSSFRCLKKKKNYHPYPARTPIAIHGGIRAQIKRSQKSRKPWAVKWIDYIERLSMGARLGRGRGYATSGQVFDISISPGLISAKVQGVDPSPYLCTFQCETLNESARKEILSELKNSPLLLSQLLVHNLPDSLERHFQALSCPLIPTIEHCLVPRCSCLDHSEHCKHIAAVLLILCEAIEQDPLLLLRYRGITENDLFGDNSLPKISLSRKPLPVQRPSSFWGFDELPPVICTPSSDKQPPSPLLTRLGTFPFWCGEERFLETLLDCFSRTQ